MTLCLSLHMTEFCLADDDPDPTIDTVEKKLELSRHEKLLGRIAEPETSLEGFTTDGCSGGLSAGWEYLSSLFPELAVTHGEKPPWQDCCIKHDIEYHAGGGRGLSAIESFEQRKNADLLLLSCVKETGEGRSFELQAKYGLSDAQVTKIYQSIAELMYRAVRLGGIPCTDQPWRWGYGWPLCHQVSFNVLTTPTNAQYSADSPKRLKGKSTPRP
jgi:hypothetical protein